MNTVTINITSLVMLLSALNPIYAQISTDGSLGAVQQFEGANIVLPATLGEQNGSHLFHSFAEFNIRQDQSVTFSGPDSINNVISRVTGGQPSLINGLLTSTIPNADFYLINPYGIRLGEQARLDIQGIFHASTAEGLSFEDGGYFSAGSPAMSLLSTAPPVAFGLLDRPLQPAEIVITTDVQNSTFYAPAGSITVRKIGDLRIHDSILSATQGTVDIQATGLFDLSLSTIALLPYYPDGQIIGNLDARNGYINIQAQGFNAHKALMLADNFTRPQGLGVNVEVMDAVNLEAGASIVSFNVNPDGQGGDIRIAADRLIVSGINPELSVEPGSDTPSNDSSTITTNSFAGQGGNIIINANQVRAEQKAVLQSAVREGRGGSIDIQTQQLTLGQALISASSVGPGQAGNIMITADNIVMDGTQGVAVIGSSAGFQSTGHAGNVDIDTDTLSLNFGEINSINSGPGRAGSIQIRSNVVDLTNQSFILTDAQLDEAGNIEVNATDQLTLTQQSLIAAASNGSASDDQGGNIILQTEQFLLNDSAVLASANAGQGGNVEMQIGQLATSGNSRIDVTSRLNLNGNIFINDTNINTVVTVLTNTLPQPRPLVECSPKKQAELSSFVNKFYQIIPNSPYEFYFLSGNTLTQQDLLQKLSENPPPLQRAAYLNDLANIFSLELRQNRYFKHYRAAEAMLGQLQPVLASYTNLPQQFSAEQELTELHENLVNLLYQQALQQPFNDSLYQATIFLNQTRFQAEIELLPYDRTIIAKQYIDKVTDTDKKMQLLLALYQIDPQLDYLYAAQRLAVHSDNTYLQSWVYGLLAESGQDASSNFQKAIFYAGNSQNSPELRYRWYWQRGQLENSMADYLRAIEAIAQLRPVLIESYLGSPRYFDELVEQVYFEAITLLFDKTQHSANPQQSLQYILQLLADFKSIELQNYLQDACIAESAPASQLASTPANTAVFYPVPLENGEIGLILQIGATLHLIDGGLIGRYGAYERAINYRERLYQKLIDPIKPLLEQHTVDTLVIAPIGKLRTVPFAALYDQASQQYLIQQYALAMLYQVPDTAPQAKNLSNSRVLLAGLSEGVVVDSEGVVQLRTSNAALAGNRTNQYDERTGENIFSALPQVLPELQAIKALYPRHTALMNPQFTQGRIDQAITNTAYPIVHFATHASFGSRAEDSYLLAYDQKIAFNTLENILSVNLSRQQPVELLTLSACQTAQGTLEGDTEQAALGLAGIGLKTGAQSVLATLWSINDKAAAELTSEFYQQLQNPDMTRAKALQAAQLKLIDTQGDKQDPSAWTWAAFVMIGNWL